MAGCNPRRCLMRAIAGAERREQSIRDWLRRRVAALAGMPAEAIDCAEPLNYLGSDSMALAGLSGELGDWIGRSLPPTLFYDWPSIDATARYLAGQQQRENFARTVIDGPIAVVGVACRFPGGDDVNTFWDFLRRAGEAVSEVPLDRWPSGGDEPAVRNGSFLPRVDLFDAQFFGIRAAKRSEWIRSSDFCWKSPGRHWRTPRLRLHPRPGQTGVFVGISTADYMRMQVGAFDSYTATGNAFSIAPNRLSYRLDLRGPSVAVDTACSSSLVAVHQACEALRRDDCDLALAGGVNLVLCPDLSLSLSKAGMLAPDGRCKVFDAAADGYGRGEGCGVVVLKRLGDALAAGDDILAVIGGTAVNQDGRSNGLHRAERSRAASRHPRGARARRRAARGHRLGRMSRDGTLLGDPVEVGALSATLLEGRDSKRPLRLTSVKANIGHLESAAGIAGLIKVVLGLRHGVVPRQAGLHQVNPHLAIDGTPVQFPIENEPLPADERFAGVSSFRIWRDECARGSPRPHPCVRPHRRRNRIAPICSVFRHAIVPPSLR